MFRVKYFKKMGGLCLFIFLFLTTIILFHQKLSSLSDNNSLESNKDIKDHGILSKDFESNLNDSDKNMLGQIKLLKEFNKQRVQRKMTLLEIQGGEPLDEINKMKRNKVKEMMKFAWDNYVQYAWGENELRPISKIGHSANIFGQTKMGISIIDSLDTLYIMGLNDEFNKALNWIKQNLNFNLTTDISVFELTIRFLGGLLTAYTFTKDKVLLDKATILGENLLNAFDKKGSLPYSLINFESQFAHNYNWATGNCNILSEIGTLHMEFAYLSELTGNNSYVNKVNKVREILYKAPKQNGLYMNFIHPISHNWCSSFASLAGLGDSFYEYLLKEYIRSNFKDKLALKMYQSSMEANFKAGMFKSSIDDNVFVSDYKAGKTLNKMDHLACFSGGMMALGAIHMKDPIKWLNLGMKVTNTCHISYAKTESKLGPESFHFMKDIEAVAVNENEKAYLLRPEAFESYFYLWRITKDQKYRDWAYEAVLALEKHSKTEFGFSGIRDVYSVPVTHDDVQQSYLMAETFKYLYLIFSEDSLLPLNRWVFNTEGHPLPIKDVNFS